MVLAAAVLATAPASATASKGDRQARPSPWQAVPDGPFTYPAGQVCPFELRGDVVEDGDWTSTFERYPDGRPRRQVVVGPLVFRVSNVETGRSVVRNFGGTTEVLLREDGATVYKAIGAIGVGIYEERDPHPPAAGFYLASGYTVLEIEADGTHRVPEATGPWENLCETLS